MRQLSPDALRQMSTRLLAVVFSIVLTAAALSAQSQVGSLHGEVMDQTGAVIPNADITLKAANGKTISAKSDSAGSYAVRNLAPGKYNVAVQEKGFRPNAQDIELAPGESKKLNVTLQVFVEEEHVDVQSEGAHVSTNPDDNASSLIITGKDLDALSDDPDDLQAELQALAGPSAGPNGGQIYIDGFTGGQLPPKSSIREIRINRNPFSAEYDRMGYGRIEVFTKPGTDKLHGQFFYNDNHSVFDALNPFAAIEPDFSAQIFNGDVSGALSKKASYFVTVQRRDINDAAVVKETAFLAAGEPVVPVSTPRLRTNASARLDYQLSTNNTLTGRYQFTRETADNSGVGQLSLPAFGYNQASTEHTVQLSDTQILSPRAVNETRFEWQRDNTGENALNFTPTVNVLGEFTNGGNPVGISQVTIHHYELQNYTSMERGVHSLRFGGRFRVSSEDDNATQNFNGTFTFATSQNFVNGLPSQFSITTGNPAISNTFVDAGLYAEDDWKIRQNMTLSYGLRFETQNGIRDHGDWAPRLGFAWGLGGKKNAPPKTVIRTGFGIFYDRFGQDLILQAERLNGINQQQLTLSNNTPAGQALLASLFSQYPNLPSLSGLSAIPSTTYTINPTLRTPYAVQAAASVERQLTKLSTLTLTYIHSHGVHQLFSIDTNALTGGAPAYQYQSEGVFNQNQLIAHFLIRAGTKLTLFSYSVLNYANADTAGAGTFPSNPILGITADYGRAAFDARNRTFFGGSISLPHGFRVSPFMLFNTGEPFDITTGTDLNGDSIFNDRPAFATSLTAPENLRVTDFGDFDIAPGPNEPRIPNNFGDAPRQFTLNLRLSKTIGLGPKVEGGGDRQPMGGGPRGGPGGHGHGGGGPMRGGGPFGERSNQRYSLTFSTMVHNIFNNVNPAAPVGNLSSQQFGQSIALAGGPFNTQSANRRLDFQMIFAF
ncbi:MAG TPA: carboxypeptidase regulatory-like domain-containing protein [Candidatus Angelobacter sp.]|nr:carboxypeptidase regulatory-like domain-containing protein [Candidatus Angelobacter sp.]